MEGEKHQTKDGYICERCWNNPSLFFPEKIINSNIWKEAQEILSTQTSDNDYLELNVLKLLQKDVTLYSGKLKIKEILKLYSVFNFKEDKFTGYQRGVDEVKLRELYNYLINFPLAVLPGLVISVRNTINFKPINNEINSLQDFGKIKIPLKKGSLWIIDGQHRVLVFEKIIGSITNFDTKKNSDVELFKKLMNYELAVIFIDSKKASSYLEMREIKTSPEDIEKAIFYIINKTQKRLSPSLEDSLQYSISKAGLRGLPAIDRQSWRVDATEISIFLNENTNSPLYNNINLSGQSRSRKPIQLNSFVSSLKPLYYNNVFRELSINDQKTLVLNYWKCIYNTYKIELSDEKYKNYMILTSMGIYALNLILLDYINLNINSIIDDSKINNFVKYMKDFNWNKTNPKLSGFGGMKGVKILRELLLNYMKTKGVKLTND